MWVRAKLHAMFKIGAKDPDGVVELALPDETDVAGLAEALRETSLMLDPRACLAMIGGAIAPLDRTLKDGEKVHFYPTLTGGGEISFNGAVGLQSPASGNERLMAILGQTRRDKW